MNSHFNSPRSGFTKGGITEGFSLPKMVPPSLARLAAGACAMAVAGCSGSGGSGAIDGVADEMHMSADSPLTGTLVVEERNGKTVFDGWFIQGSAAEVASPVDSSSTITDTCSVEQTAVSASLADNAESESWATQSVGPAISIASRTGDFESLVKQDNNEITVYAPSQRWQSAAVPDDATLNFPAESNLGEEHSVTLPELPPLVWIAPETGVMASSASQLKWEAGGDDSRLSVKLSAIDFSNSSEPVVINVNCELRDDGEFTLPASFQQSLPNDRNGIVVYAVRERVQVIENGDTTLSVVQLSYPEAVK